MARLARTNAPLRTVFLAACAALTAAGCGSSATTSVTAPGSVSKCGVSVASPGAPLPARGGSGEVAVTTARECAWSASSESGWLTIKAGASGQGDGAVQFEASSNPDPAVRRGAIVLNNQRAEIMQAGGECTFALAEDGASFEPAGGSGRVDVRPSSALCTWTAASDVDWITIRSGASGTGSAAVTFDVAATSGPPRTGAINVAGRRFVVTQSQGCAYSLSSTAYQTGAQGGTGMVGVTTTAGCTWSAVSNVDWITVTAGGTSTSGPGTAAFTVSAVSGPTRSATLTIAGQPFTVTQAQGCAYTVSPDSASVPAAGGAVPIAVAAGTGCAWTAASQTPWITITSGAQGSGNGTVQLNVDATSGPNRSGTAVIAGRTFTVNQGQGCTFTISPASGSVEPAGGQGSFEVQASSGCAWAATENADWLSIASGATGAGNGTVRFAASANTGPARTATITAAGRTFTVSQAAGCSYTLSSSSSNVPGGGGTGSVGVTSAAGCAWAAASNAGWITLTGGSSGTGTGTVSFSVAAHTGARRSATLTIAGHAFTVTQAESCSYAVTPDQRNVAASGEAVPVTVNSADGCRWSAASNVSWITVPGGAGGTGNGTVQLSVAANSGGPRNGTATVAGRTVTIAQAGGCSYAISPSAQTVAAQGGGGIISIVTPASCGWIAEGNLSWARITGATSGSGNGSVQFTADPNTGLMRNGALTIAGQTFTLTQEGCTFAVTPDTLARPGGTANGQVVVTAGAGCGWIAVSNVAWATISSGASGTGDGAVEIALAANTGPAARSGTLTVATRTVTVSQESGCTYSLSAPSYAAPAGGGPSSVNVAANPGCAWTATVNPANPWITIASGTPGDGNGTVQFVVEANTSGGPRTGTITIGNQVFTVTQ